VLKRFSSSVEALVMAQELHVAYDPVLQSCDAASFDNGIPTFLIKVLPSSLTIN
jgi:hypothetical protein